MVDLTFSRLTQCRSKLGIEEPVHLSKIESITFSKAKFHCNFDVVDYIIHKVKNTRKMIVKITSII